MNELYISYVFLLCVSLIIFLVGVSRGVFLTTQLGWNNGGFIRAVFGKQLLRVCLLGMAETWWWLHPLHSRCVLPRWDLLCERSQVLLHISLCHWLQHNDSVPNNRRSVSFCRSYHKASLWSVCLLHRQCCEKCTTSRCWYWRGAGYRCILDVGVFSRTVSSLWYRGICGYWNVVSRWQILCWSFHVLLQAPIYCQFHWHEAI